MKKVRNILLVLVTLLLTVAGAAMPYLASRAQDARVAQADTVRDLDAVRLTLWEPTEIGSVLKMVAGADTSETYWPGETHMTAAEAAAAVESIAEQLAEAGLLDAWQAAEAETVPTLMVSGDGEVSAVIWKYIEPYAGFQALVDDSSGKLVALQGFSPWLEFVREVVMDTGDAYMVAADRERLRERMEGWAGFCRDYYGAAQVACDLEASGRTGILRLLSPGGEEEVRLNVVVWEDWTLFNGENAE